MKKILLTLFVALMAVAGWAQTELLTNGNFESWTAGQPDEWKSTTTASNATLEQSTDAHAGSYAVVVKNATSNKRLAYKELALKAGTYTFSLWVKSGDAEKKGSIRLGYVPLGADGKVGTYVYGDYTNDIATTWVQVTFQFKLEAAATINLVAMNPKTDNKNQKFYSDLIVDDASLTTTDGGLDDGGGGGGGDVPGEDIITIEAAQKLSAGSSCTIEGTVVAVNTRGAVFADATGYIYYYNQSISGLAVGDKCTVKGAVSAYGGFNQFTATATITKTGTETFALPEPEEIDLDAWAASPVVQYVKVTGVLSISGAYYNLAVEGSTAKGSIIYPTEELTKGLTSGSTVTVYGIAVYTSSNNSYVNIAATAITIDNAVIGKDITNTPDSAYTVSEARALIAAGEGLDCKVYVKGTVKGTPAIDLTFGNATYWIKNETDTLEVYRGLYLKNEKFPSEAALKEGDEVIVYGQLVNYNGTYEFTQGNYLYSINGKTEPDDVPIVVTFTDITIAEAVAAVEGKTTANVTAKSNTRLVLTNAEVVYADADAVFVRQDGKAVELYQLGLTCKAGDLLGGEVKCHLKNYYGIPEFTKCDSTDVTTILVSETGQTPVPVQSTVSDVVELRNLCNLVELQGVTVSLDTLGNTYLTDAEGHKLQLRTRTPGIAAPEDYEGKTYTVTGIPGYIYKNAGQLFALSFTATGSSVASVSLDGQKNEVFDLAGRRITQPRRGLYIMRGKKVLVK